MLTYLLQYEFGNATDNEYKPLAWPLVQARIQGRIDKIKEATGADSYQLYLTTDDKSNFRYKIATIRPYKGNRPSEKPHYYHHIRNFLVDQRGAQEVSGMEADDALSIKQWKDYRAAYESSSLNNWQPYLPQFLQPRSKTVICSRDKDLDMVPGWHYNWGAGNQKEKPMWWQDEINGLRSFYSQLLTGDSVDNIPGLYGVGKNSKVLDKLGSCSTELDMYNLVYSQYDLRFGSYAEQFLLENARLLWMLREEGELWEPPLKK